MKYFDKIIFLSWAIPLCFSSFCLLLPLFCWAIYFRLCKCGLFFLLFSFIFFFPKQTWTLYNVWFWFCFLFCFDKKIYVTLVENIRAILLLSQCCHSPISCKALLLCMPWKHYCKLKGRMYVWCLQSGIKTHISTHKKKGIISQILSTPSYLWLTSES